MAPLNVFTILSTLVVLISAPLSAAQSGTISGFPVPPFTTGAPFPISNGTLSGGPTASGSFMPTGIPTGSGGGSPASILPSGSGNGEAGSTCAAPVTVTTTIQATVTVTVPAGGSEAGSTASAAPTGPPYSIPGGGSGSIGTGTGISGTAASTGVVLPTGYVQKRYEMRGLKEEQKEKRAHFWG